MKPRATSPCCSDSGTERISVVFFQTFVYLAAAVIALPIAKRLGLGSVLDYLLAGVATGPFAFGLIGRDGQDLMHFAEFGVVMLLFW